MATLTGISIGSTVAVNAHGVKYVTTDATETTRISEEGNVIYEIADFLHAGMCGKVVDERLHSQEVAVRFDDDPVAGRAFWMCVDEIVKEEA
jgi:hypothetical protein